MPVGRFVSRPIEIEAIQWTGDNQAEISAFVVPHNGQPGFRTKPAKNKAQIWDSLGKEWLTVPLNDWVIKGEYGNFYALDADLFERKYASLDPKLISDDVPADSPFREGAEGK